MQSFPTDSVVHAAPVSRFSLHASTLATFPPHRRHTAILVRNVDTLLHAQIRFRGIDNPLLDVRRQAVERLFDVDVALRRHLHERDPQLVCQLLAPLYRNDSLLFPVAFVANQDLVDAFRGVLFDVGEPSSDIWEIVSSEVLTLRETQSRQETLLLKDRSSVTS